MGWSIEHAYDEFPRIEEEFGAALDQSLAPRGPDQLYDIVAGFGLAAGAVALDVGCGEGGHTVELKRRFGSTSPGSIPCPGASTRPAPRRRTSRSCSAALRHCRPRTPQSTWCGA